MYYRQTRQVVSRQCTHRTRLHTETFTHRRFTHRHFYTLTLLHTNAFTHKRFYTQTLLHTHTHTHTRFSYDNLCQPYSGNQWFRNFILFSFWFSFFIIDIYIFSKICCSFFLAFSFFFITNSSDCIVLVFFCLFYDVFRWCIEMCWSVFNSFAHSTVATPCLTKWISLLTSNLVLSELEWAGHCRAGGGREVRWAGWWGRLAGW